MELLLLLYNFNTGSFLYLSCIFPTYLEMLVVCNCFLGAYFYDIQTVAQDHIFMSDHRNRHCFRGNTDQLIFLGT